MNEVNITTAHGTESFDSFVVTNSGLIQAFVEDYQRNYGSVRLHVRVDAIFARDVGEGLLQRIPAFFLVPFKISTVHNNSTYNLSPATSRHKLTIGTLEAAALSWSALPSLYFVFLSIDPCMALHIFPLPNGSVRKNVLQM